MTKFRVFLVGPESIKDDILNLLNVNSSPRGTNLTYEDAYIIVDFEHKDNDDYNYEIFVKTGTENIRVYNRYRDNELNSKTHYNVYRKGYWIIYLKNILEKSVPDVQYFQQKRSASRVVRDNVAGKQTMVEPVAQQIALAPKSNLDSVD